MIADAKAQRSAILAGAEDERQRILREAATEADAARAKAAMEAEAARTRAAEEAKTARAQATEAAAQADAARARAEEAEAARAQAVEAEAAAHLAAEEVRRAAADEAARVEAVRAEVARAKGATNGVGGGSPLQYNDDDAAAAAAHAPALWPVTLDVLPVSIDCGAAATLMQASARGRVARRHVKTIRRSPRDAILMSDPIVGISFDLTLDPRTGTPALEFTYEQASGGSPITLAETATTYVRFDDAAGHISGTYRARAIRSAYLCIRARIIAVQCVARGWLSRFGALIEPNTPCRVLLGLSE